MNVQSDVPTRSLYPFLIIAFGIVWAVFALLILFPEPIEAAFGELRFGHPLYILAVYAPAIAAFILVLRHAGVAGLGRFLSRLLLWRAPLIWYVLLIVVLPLVFFIGAAIGGTPMDQMLVLAPPGELIALIAFMLVLGPIEEFGWRGYALPLLQRKMAPIWASIILGAIWGLWHLPAFFLGGTLHSGWDFLPFFLGAIAVSVIVTPFFNAAGGSILIAMLFHWQLNMPMWPDAQPFDNYVVAVLAVVVVWFNRAAMFGRAEAVTAVVPDAVAARGG